MQEVRSKKGKVDEGIEEERAAEKEGSVKV